MSIYVCNMLIRTLDCFTGREYDFILIGIVFFQIWKYFFSPYIEKMLIRNFYNIDFESQNFRKFFTVQGDRIQTQQ